MIQWCIIIKPTEVRPQEQGAVGVPGPHEEFLGPPPPPEEAEAVQEDEDMQHARMVEESRRQWDMHGM